MVRHGRGSAAEVWGERLDRFRVSKLSVREFCARESVSEPSFYQWRKKLTGAPRKRQRAATSVFQSVRVTPAAGVLTIDFPGGARVEAPADHIELARTLVMEVARASRADDSGGASC